MTFEEARDYSASVRQLFIDFGFGWVVAEVDQELSREDDIERDGPPEFRELRFLADALENVVLGRALMDDALLENYAISEVYFLSPDERRIAHRITRGRSGAIGEAGIVRSTVIEQTKIALQRLRDALNGR